MTHRRRCEREARSASGHPRSITRRPRSVATASRRPSGENAPSRASENGPRTTRPSVKCTAWQDCGQRRRDRGGCRAGTSRARAARPWRGVDPTPGGPCGPGSAGRRRRRRTPTLVRARAARTCARRPPPPRAPRGRRSGRERAGCSRPARAVALGTKNQDSPSDRGSLRSGANEVASPSPNTTSRPPVKVRKYGGSPPVSCGTWCVVAVPPAASTRISVPGSRPAR